MPDLHDNAQVPLGVSAQECEGIFALGQDARSIIGAENAGVEVDDRGVIPVDNQLRTNVPHIFAIGDIVGNPMLAHKASHEAHIAAEVIAGKKHFGSVTVTVGTTLKQAELQLIEATLESTGGDKEIAANVLGIASRTIYRKLK